MKKILHVILLLLKNHVIGEAMKNIGKKSLVLSICNITTVVITMIISMFIARYRTLEENGTYSQILLIINTVISFAVLGIPNSITYFLGKATNRLDKNRYVRTYYTAMFLICAIVGVVLYALAPCIAEYYENESLMKLRYVFLVLPLFLQFTSTISDVLISFEKVWLLMGYRIIYSISLLGINILMVILKWDFLKYMFIYLCTLFVLTIIVYIIVNTKLGVKKIIYIDFHLLSEILKFAIPMGIATVVGTLSIEFDKLFISAKFSTEVLGMYNYMAKELPIVVITSSVTSILLPTIAGMMGKGKKDDALELWKQSTIITFSITAFFVCGVFTYAPQVIKILYSAKYLSGITIFRIYTLSLLLRFTYFGLFFNCTGNSKKAMKYSIYGLCLNICLNFVFYYFFGIIGPAIATVVSLYIATFLQLKGTSKLLNRRIGEMLPWREFVQIIILNVFLALLFYFLQRVIKFDFVIGDCAEAVLLAGVWFAAYWILWGRKLKNVWKALNS